MRSSNAKVLLCSSAAISVLAWSKFDHSQSGVAMTGLQALMSLQNLQRAVNALPLSVLSETDRAFTEVVKRSRDAVQPFVPKLADSKVMQLSSFSCSSWLAPPLPLRYSKARRQRTSLASVDEDGRPFRRFVATEDGSRLQERGRRRRRSVPSDWPTPLVREDIREASVL